MLTTKDYACVKCVCGGGHTFKYLSTIKVLALQVIKDFLKILIIRILIIRKILIIFSKIRKILIIIILILLNQYYLKLYSFILYFIIFIY